MRAHQKKAPLLLSRRQSHLTMKAHPPTPIQRKLRSCSADDRATKRATRTTTDLAQYAYASLHTIHAQKPQKTSAATTAEYGPTWHGHTHAGRTFPSCCGCPSLGHTCCKVGTNSHTHTHPRACAHTAAVSDDARKVFRGCTYCSHSLPIF